MNKYKILLIIIGLLLLPTQVLVAQTAKPVFLTDIRSSAMGGAGIASARGSFSYIYNPALLAKEQFRLTLPGFQLEFGNDFLEIIDYAKQNQENFKKLDKDSINVSAKEKDEILNELRVDATRLDNIWYKTTVTPYLGIVAQHIGISIYNIAYFATKIDVGVIAPKIKLYALNDVVASFGYGHQYDENLALGIGAKIIRRFEAPEFKIQVEQASGLDETLEEGFDKMEKGETGYGVDLGALYKLNNQIELAAVAQDILGKVGAINTPMNIKLGMMYQYNSHLVFAADLEDFFNRNGDKLVNKIYLGGEYRLPVISLRLGFGQGYPAVGIGLNFWVLDLSYTYYTKELTNSPGNKAESYHLAGLKLGWQ